MEDLNDIKQLLAATLIEPPGQLTKDLILLCKGLLALDPNDKTVRLAQETKMADKERIVMFCLGKRLLAVHLGDPSLSEVSWDDLSQELGIDKRTVSAHASVLIDKDRTLMRSARGQYQVRLAAMPGFVSALRKKLNLNGK